MRRCALYTRVSTVRQAVQRDGSLDNQLARLRAYTEYKNTSSSPEDRWEIVDEFVDRGESGKDLDRPELQRLVGCIERGEVDTVITVKIDRISRSLRDFFGLWDLFQKHSVEFVSLGDNFDTGTAMGRASLKIILVFAELERETTGERTASTMAYRASIGLRNGGRVLGYDLNPENRGIPLVNKDQAALVRDIFSRYLEFGSVGKVVRYLAKKQVRRPVYTSRRGQEHGGGPFAVQAVINILRNPFYVGKIVHKGEVFDGQHEAIIDEVTWERVQRLLGKQGDRPRGLPGVPRRRNADAPLHIYTLKGLLRCGKCGSYMTPTSGTNGKNRSYFYYECTKHAQAGTDACSTPYLSAQAIEDIIVERLREIANDEVALRDLTKRANEEQNKAAAALAERESRLAAKLDALRERIAPYLDLIETQGRAALPSIEERLGNLEGERRSLDEELKLAAHERRQLEERTLQVEVVVDAYRALREALASNDVKTLEAILPTIIETVTWTPNEEDGGGCYNLSLYENPLELQGLRVPGEPAKEVSSCLERSWLPSRDDERGSQPRFRPGRLYDSGKVWAYREKRQPRFALVAPQPRQTREAYLRRGWQRNPLVVAQEMKAILEKETNATQGQVAKHFKVSRSRVAQYLGLLRLPDDVVAFVVADENEKYVAHLTEGNLREIAAMPDPIRQRRSFAALLSGAPQTVR